VRWNDVSRIVNDGFSHVHGSLNGVSDVSGYRERCRVSSEACEMVKGRRFDVRGVKQVFGHGRCANRLKEEGG
jgi:hypothetical protein